MKRFISIRKKLFVSITIAVVFVLFLSTMLNYSYFRNVLRERVLTDQKQLSEACVDNIQGMFDEYERISYYLAGDQSIAEILSQDEAGEILSSYAAQNLRDVLLRYIQVPYSSSPISTQCILYLSDQFQLSSQLSSAALGEVSTWTVASSLRSESGVLDDDWFVQCQQQAGSLYIFTLPEQPDNLYFGRIIRNTYLSSPEHSIQMGTLVFSVSRRQLGNLLTDSAVFDGSQIYLALNDQILCTGGEALELNSLSDQEDFSNLSAMNVFQPLTVDGQNYYGVRYNLGHNVNLLWLVPTQEIDSSLSGIGFLMALMMLAAVGICLAVTALLTYQFTKPILDLTTVIQQVDNPEQQNHIPIQPSRNDEIGILFRRYNEMMERIARLMADIKITLQRQKTAEIQALQAQINPHFVFNTLDSINWIALCEDKKDISLMVTSLAKMLRYSISGEETQALLRDELEYLQEYCRIQELRYPGEFTVTIDLPESLMEIQIPKMLLQPLVENAILHFHDNGQNAGKLLEILISCESRDGYLLLRVSNTGSGDPERINGYLSGENTLTPKGGGFGIRNVDRRIKLYFGDAYGLSFIPWDSDSRKGITAELRLPISKSKLEKNS